MVIYATMTRAGLRRRSPTPSQRRGLVLPQRAIHQRAKHYAAADYSLMVRHLHDIGGGSILTAPPIQDCRAKRSGPFIEKYMATKEGISGEYRLRLFHAIRDFTDAYGGWQLVTMLQSGGGPYAQRWSRASTTTWGPRQEAGPAGWPACQ